MSWFLSITNFDELKMVPEGQTHVRRASPRVAAYASRAGAGRCPENVRLSTARRRLARLRHPINASQARPRPSARSPRRSARPPRLTWSGQVWTPANEDLITGQTAVPPKPAAVLPRPCRRHTTQDQLRGHWVTGTGNPINSEYLNP